MRRSSKRPHKLHGTLKDFGMSWYRRDRLSKFCPILVFALLATILAPVILLHRIVLGILHFIKWTLFKWIRYLNTFPSIYHTYTLSGALNFYSWWNTCGVSAGRWCLHGQQLVLLPPSRSGGIPSDNRNPTQPHTHMVVALSRYFLQQRSPHSTLTTT